MSPYGRYILVMRAGIITVYLFFAGIFFPDVSFAQVNGTDQMPVNKPNEQQYKCYTQAAVELMYPISDKAFVKSLKGIYGLHAAFLASINKRLMAGLEFRNEEFAVAVNPAYLSVKTCMFLYRGGIKLTYHTTTANDFMFNASLSGGETYIIFNNIPQLAPPTPKGGFVQHSPYYGLCITEGYKIDNQYWIGLTATFTYLPYTYNPDYVGLNNYEEFNPSDKVGPTTYLGWGFEASYAFGKKK